MLDARKAGEERRDIVERTTRGRNQKAKGGKVVGSGKPLYGFEDIGGAFAVVESEARIVRLIYKWYVENGKSDKAITHELSTMGIKTPGEAKGAGPKHSAGVWRHTIVRLILRNEAYCGVYHYGKVIGSRGKGGRVLPISISRRTCRRLSRVSCGRLPKISASTTSKCRRAIPKTRTCYAA